MTTVKRKVKAKKRISWDADAYHEATQAVLTALTDLTQAQQRLYSAVLRLI